MHLAPPPDLFSFEDGGWRMAMGLQALDPADWLLVDTTYPEQMAERARILAESRANVLHLPDRARPAAAELLALALEHLTTHHPGLLERRDGRLRNRVTGVEIDRAMAADDPLGALNGLAAEDFCILQPGPDGPLRFAAGLLCFPNRWRLLDKIGHPLAGVHGPVPLYADRLANPVDRFLSVLAADRPVWRMNWGLSDDPALHLPDDLGTPDPDLTAETAGERLWLRVERQTLRRLPETGAVVFTIRTYQQTVAQAARTPDRARRLATTLRALPAAMARYKATDRTGPPVLAYLDALS